MFHAILKSSLAGFFAFFCLHLAFAQGDSLRDHEPRFRRWYFYWGYNRGYFSKTNLHFHGPNYDFTLYNLKGHDQPEKFSWKYFNPAEFSVPQYNVRLGYFFNRHFSVSFGMDHLKYVMTRNQPTTISGVISAEASPKYAGAYLNQPIQVEWDLLVFEHTNGFNLVSLDLEWQERLSKKTKPWGFSWNAGLGGIWVVTKTDVRVFTDGLDNDFHVAGFTMAGKTGPRLEWRRRAFLSAEAKCGYATLPAVLIKNDAPELGDHNLVYFEWYVVAGLYFGR